MSTDSPSKLQAAYDELMNLQPHIAQLPERYRPFIDSHVDVAMAHLQEALSETGAQPNAVDAEVTSHAGVTSGPASAAPSGDKSHRRCPHEIWERETAVADGMCPLCLSVELNAERSATRAIPRELFDEYTVLCELDASAKLSGGDVASVLDAVVRMIKRNLEKKKSEHV